MKNAIVIFQNKDYTKLNKNRILTVLTIDIDKKRHGAMNIFLVLECWNLRLSFSMKLVIIFSEDKIWWDHHGEALRWWSSKTEWLEGGNEAIQGRQEVRWFSFVDIRWWKLKLVEVDWISSTMISLTTSD